MARAALFAAAIALVPGPAEAQALSQVAGVFNIIVGLMLVAAFLLFFGGLAMWFSRLGTYPTNRDEAIKLMQWGVVVLFVLAVFLALSQFVQKHAAAAAFVAGIVIVAAGIWVVFTVATAKEEGADEH